MKKPDLKKLALMGMAGGLLVSANSLSADNSLGQETGYGTLLAGHGCGSKCSSYRGNSQGCGGVAGNSHGCGGIADTYNPNNMQETPWQQSCSGYRQPQGYNYQSQQSCSGSGQAPQHSCGGNGHCNHKPQPSPQPAQPQPKPQPAQPQNQPMNPQSYNYRNQNRYLADADTEATTPAAKAPMTEAQLVKQLNPEAKATFENLSPEGKALALKLANQSCKGQNDCKGLGSCKSDDHSCAGKNGCKGQSAGPFKDKNLAVKVAAEKMAEKRKNALKNK